MTNTATTTSVWKAVCTIVGDESAPFDEHASLFDMGLDSLGLAELVIQLEEKYGEGAITIDDVLANPIVSSIAAHLVLQAASCTSQAPSRTSPAAASPAVASTDTPAARAIFLFAGEGAHSAGVDLTVLKTSPSWLAVDATIFAQHGASADDFLAMHLGDHTAPYSPVVTTILNILQADLWKLWGRTRAPGRERLAFAYPCVAVAAPISLSCTPPVRVLVCVCYPRTTRRAVVCPRPLGG